MVISFLESILQHPFTLYGFDTGSDDSDCEKCGSENNICNLLRGISNFVSCELLPSLYFPFIFMIKTVVSYGTCIRPKKKVMEHELLNIMFTGLIWQSHSYYMVSSSMAIL